MALKIVADRVQGSSPDLAFMLGVTDRRVRQLEKSRVTLRVAHGLYDITGSVQAYCNWLRGQEGAGSDVQNEVEERTRLTAAKADLAELDMAEREGDLVSKAGVRKQDFILARILRNNLQSMPDRIAALVAAESDAATCHQMILSEVNASLESVIESLMGEQVDEGELDIARRRAADELDASSQSRVSQETSARGEPG